MSKRPTKPRPARRPATTFATSVSAPAFPSAADRPRPGAGVPRGQWLTRLAIGLAVVVVVARVLMSETLRPPGTVSPGSPEVPAGPGPAAGLLLDLLAGLCPLLVLARRWFDPSFSLRAAGSPVLFLCLGTWAVASTLWASDKFAAVVSASHLLAAAGLCWAVAQVARQWRDLWRAAACSAGLLAVLLTHGLWYYVIDRQDLIDQFDRDPSFVAKVQNVQPGTFAFTQLENSIRHGELRGFSVSANTYGALLVLLGLVTAGAGVECVRRRRWGGVVVAAALLATTAAVLPLAQSRTALLTGVGGVGLLLAGQGMAAWPPAAGLLRRRSAGLYFAGLLAVLAGIAFVVGYGISRGSLFHESLDFRWRYWTASADLWRLHPWAGVGWENFGYHYLGVRTPEATEEIKDPHNFLVRFATELGLVGGLLAALWAARTWWDVTRPIDPPGRGEPDGGRDGETPGGNDADGSTTAVVARPPRAGPGATLLAVAAPLVVGVCVNVLASVDLAGDPAYARSEVVRRVVYLVALLAAAAPLALRLVPLNDRGDLTVGRAASAAPAVRAGLLVGLGMFFVHNLVDFAMFEVGPMFLMALLLGVAVGTRSRPPATESAAGLTSDSNPVSADSAAAARRGRRLARLAVAVLGAGWLLAAALLVGPVVAAEAAAARADDDLRANRARPAALGYESAFAEAVRNADYAARAARAWGYADDAGRARAAYDAAVAANPADPAGYADRAELLASLIPPDLSGATADLGRAVGLDPMNRGNRLRYAALLEQAGRRRAALAQYAAALDLNERLTSIEKKRLTPAQVWHTFEGIVRLTREVLLP
jgi:hypothetical protein